MYKLYIALLIFALTIGCSSIDQSTPIEEHFDLKVGINPNEPINDILSTATLQKSAGQFLLNYINQNDHKFITLNLTSKQREEVQFEIEGPHSLGVEPYMFYRNTSKSIITLSSGSLCALCKVKDNSIQQIQKLEPNPYLWLPSGRSFRTDIQENNLLFWNLKNKNSPQLSLLNIDNFKFQQVNIPYDAEFLHPFQSKTILKSDNFLPFITLSDGNFIFSNWYSPNIYILSKDKKLVKRKLSLYNCENDLASFFDSLEGALNAEYEKKAHGPVTFFKGKNIYLSENYYIPEKTSILVNLNTSGKEIFSLKERDNARHQKFWLGDQLAILIINEEKNFLELKVYE